MTITITAFQASPDRGRGQARDMRVRWALEEVGQPHDVRLVSFEQMRDEAHLALQPFGQIPAFEEDGLVPFESGAIALHIVCRYPDLMPRNANAGSRTVTWIFAALNTVEPPIVAREQVMYAERRQQKTYAVMIARTYRNRSRRPQKADLILR